MSKPHVIAQIESQYQLSLALFEGTTEAFMRYGHKAADKNRYLMEEDKVVGLNLRSNGIKELDILANPALQHLQALQLTENDLTELTIPEQLTALQSLDISDNKNLKKLSLPVALPNLEVLELSDSGLEKLELPKCPALTHLDASRNQLAAFTFMDACPVLTYLDLSGNKRLSSLALPKGFMALSLLHLSNCNMQQLSIQGTLPALQVLDIKNNQLLHLPADAILDSSILTSLYAKENRPKNIPSIFLNGNSLQDAKLWFQDLRDYPPEENKTIKLMVMGNSNVGKTTLMCALQQEDERCSCKIGHESTQGIETGEIPLKNVLFNYWDFGGQEVYYGTHRLFLESDALKLIVYDAETEDMALKKIEVEDRIRDGYTIRNYPLPFWHQTAQKFNQFSHFLVAKNKVDSPYQGEETVDDEVYKYIRAQKIKRLEVDAKTGLDVDDLKNRLNKEVKQLPDYEMLIPASWVEVRQWFIDNIESKNPEPLITKTYFDQVLCATIPDQRMKDLLLQYLHHNGFLYYNKQYLGEDIIANQKWALEAIYKIFEKEHYREFREDHQGEILVSRLFDLFGDGYSEEHKALFLSFMKSCHLCFESNQQSENIKSAIYIFPEFLRAEASAAMKQFWSKGVEAFHVYRYKMDFMDYPLVQAAICQLGRKTTLDRIWRFGVVLGTPEGKLIKVELDDKKDELLVSIQTPILEKWLKPILEVFPSNLQWEEAINGTTNWQPFDLEKWQNSLKEKHSRIMEGQVEGLVSSVSDLDDVAHQSAKEKILFLPANPKPGGKLDIGKEYADIDYELEDEGGNKKLHLMQEKNIRFYNIIDGLNEKKAHVLHFVGHGAEEDPDTKTGAAFWVHDDYGRGHKKITPAMLKHALERAIKNHTQLKLVFFNFCHSEPFASLISTMGLYAIGTDGILDSEKAIWIAQQFYKQYAKTKDIEQSAKLAFALDVDRHLTGCLYHNGKKINLY